MAGAATREQVAQSILQIAEKALADAVAEIRASGGTASLSVTEGLRLVAMFNRPGVTVASPPGTGAASADAADDMHRLVDGSQAGIVNLTGMVVRIAARDERPIVFQPEQAAVSPSWELACTRTVGAIKLRTPTIRLPANMPPVVEGRYYIVDQDLAMATGRRDFLWVGPHVVSEQRDEITGFCLCCHA